MWNWIMNFFKSTWMKLFMRDAVEVLVGIIKGLKEQEFADLKAKVIELAISKMSSGEKRDAFFKYAKSRVPTVKDSAINLLREQIVNQLKDHGIIS